MVPEPTPQTLPRICTAVFIARPRDGVEQMQSLHPFRSHYDAVIVGARCAGAATAFLLTRAGVRVLLVDRQAYGSDTLSTHVLMRTGVLQLRRWGLLPMLASQGTPEISATNFHYGAESVRVAIKPEHGVQHLYAPRRTVLDKILVDAAEAAGADVQHGVLLSGLQFDSRGQVVGVHLRDTDASEYAVRCDIVIGADGRQSTVAKLVAASTYLESRSSSACVYGYFEGLPEDGLHWYFESCAAAGVIPTNQGQHCVFAGVPQHRFASTFRGAMERGFSGTLAACSPDLARGIAQARMVGRLRGFAGAKGFLRQAYGSGWALVGDAGYFKDPLTAHGITDALRDAELLAQAVLVGEERAMAMYQKERDVLSIPFFEVTDAIASFDWTLDKVKALHVRLSAAMQAETSASARMRGSSSHHLAAKENMMDRSDSPWHRTIAGRPELGATAKRVRQTSTRDVEMFTEMTGDRNPIHYDAGLARQSPFGDLIVQGGVTTGLLNAVVAEDLPGPGTVFLETNWKFIKAVRVGETITASVTVEHVRDDKPICRLETIVRDAAGEPCVQGTAMTYTMPLLAAAGGQHASGIERLAP
jgi:flavin-dependent dehydrogenase/acyl dehydratase